MIPDKGGTCGLARATGHSKDTICRWLEIAGTHSKEVTTYFLTNLNLNRVEVDEIWSYIKKQKNVTEEDPEEYGDVYSLTAIKSDTRLLLFHHEGKRSTEDALKLRIDSGNRKWFQRTPAMAEGITDHIWSLKELLTFRVPVQ